MFIHRDALRRVAEHAGFTFDVSASHSDLWQRRDVYTRGEVTVVTQWQSNGLQDVWPRVNGDVLKLRGGALRDWFRTV